jgi:hypothetical protein
MRKSSPLTDPIIVALSQLVDDAQVIRRDPSHSDLEALFRRFRIDAGDPSNQGRTVGKAKRVRETLSWASEHEPEAAGEAAYALVSTIRGLGGFRQGSPNYVGADAYKNLASAFATEGYELASDGELRARLLDNLAGAQLTEALHAYIRRAKRGVHDAALVTGTGKDLLEAVAAHVIQQRTGAYPTTTNFPTLLGQTFVMLGMATPHDRPANGEPPIKRIERAMYELACGVNQLRNKEGTGHGRPWQSTLTDGQARMAVEAMGLVSERILSVHLGKA